MMTSGSVLTFTFVFVLTFINTHCTLSNIDDFESPFNGLDLHDRDEVYDSHEIDARKPVREDGKLGGKLLETHHGIDVVYSLIICDAHIYRACFILIDFI